MGILASLTGSSQPARGQTATVDLGQEGLQNGANIDPFLDEHFVDGNEVHIPAGEYQSDLEWWDTSVSNAAIVGSADGVTLNRASSPPTWDDGGGEINPTLDFDGHVVVENITFNGRFGQVKEKLDVTGQSSDAHLELRNVNLPNGGMGCGDSQFGRARGEGQVTYQWCYIGPLPNAAFYQTSSASSDGIRQVFDGCTMVNGKDYWRGGTRDYTVRNCLYWADRPSPNWSDSGGGGPDSSGCHSSDHNPFKFDQDFQFEGTFENLHFVFHEGCGGIEHIFDFQGDQPGTSGTAGQIYVYNDEGSTNFEGGGEADGWTFGPVHLTGEYSSEGDYGVDSGDVEFVTGAAAEQPIMTLPPVWTPGGQGLPERMGGAGGDSPGGNNGGSNNGNNNGNGDGNSDEQPGNPDGDQSDGSDGSDDSNEDPSAEGSVFEIHSTDADAHIDYEFDADGTVEPYEVSGDVSSMGESNDVITDNGDGTVTVTGRTGAEYGDAFLVNSEVTDFRRIAGLSGVMLLFDGEDMTDQFLPDDGSTDDDSSGEQSGSVFEIHSTDADAHINYTFDVEGTAEKHEVTPDVSSVGESNDVITDNGDGTVSVEGRTGAGFGDAFLVAGTVLGFERISGESAVELYLDDQDVTDQFVTDDGSSDDSGSGDSDDQDDGNDDSNGGNGDPDGGDDGELPHRISLDGTGTPDEVSQYRFSVTGHVERDPDQSSLQDGGLPWDAMGDIIDDQHVVGLVGNGVDVYRFSGEVTGLEVDGSATSQIDRGG